MKKIAQGIVRLRKLILTVAVLLLIPSAIGAIATRINYDILTYLPQDLDSMIGEVALEDDFHLASTGMITVEGLPTNELIAMKNRISEFVVGLIFGLGLIVSGMTDPGKVLGFLDLAGLWDPSLAFVMGGAIAVGVFAFAVAKKRTTSFLGGAMHLPTSRDIDRRLVVGSLIFGAGWGIAGFCPGPAIVSAGAGQPKAIVFVIAMLAGMWLFELAERMSHRTPSTHTGAR